MTVESASFLSALNTALPDGGDGKSEGDNHIRLVKAVLQATFPGLAGRAFRIQTKSAGYSLAATDNMTAVVVSGSGITIATAAAIATLGNGFIAMIYASTHDVTFDPNSTEQVNGANTYVIKAGDAAMVIAGASAWTAFALISQARVAALEAAAAAVVPISVGMILPYGASSPPAGFLLCNGQLVSTTTYAELYTKIGTQFNIGGEGAGLFRIPDFRRAVPVGYTVDGNSDYFGSGTAIAMGGRTGTERVTLTAGQMPVHSHQITLQNASNDNESSDIPARSNGNSLGAYGPIASTNAGSGESHPNMQPSVGVAYIIKT